MADLLPQNSKEKTWCEPSLSFGMQTGTVKRLRMWPGRGIHGSGMRWSDARRFTCSISVAEWLGDLSSPEVGKAAHIRFADLHEVGDEFDSERGHNLWQHQA